MDKRKFNTNILYFVSILMALIISFTSCDNTDELSTNILDSKEITVKAFGPNPALRGQKLSIVGSHVDQISKVVLPNNIEISDIEIVSEKMIKITLPQETVEGNVKVYGLGGFEFQFNSLLQISEPIEILKMSPQPIKPGQTLTLEGNYFNLIDKVVFTDKVEIESKDFVVHERTKLQIILPENAQTGPVTLSNSDEIPLEYESDEILQVVLPAVANVVDLTEKKPDDLISIVGSDLDLVKKVVMPNGTEVDFEVENNKLLFTLPANISDGVIVMVPASGVEVAIAHIGVALPENLVISPSDNLRAGDIITIEGTNLELVTDIRFEGMDNAVKAESVTSTQLTVEFPEMAQSGNMVLNTASGKSVSIEVKTQKPLVSSLSPNPVSGGNQLRITGEHLDLIKVITFYDDIDVEVEALNPNELQIDVPLNAVSGVLILTMNNLEIVETDELIIDAPQFCFIPTPPGPKAEIHAGGVLTIEVENGEKLIDVQVNGESVNYIHDYPNLYVVIPGNAKGETELKLISSNGVAQYTIPVIGAGVVETVVYEGLFNLNWSEPLRLNKDLFESVPAGSKLKLYMAATDAGASVAFSDANWTKFNINDPNFDAQWGTVSLPEGTTSYEIEITSELLEGIRNISDGWSDTGLMLTGNDDMVFISKISIIVGTAPEEITIFEGPFTLDWGDPLRIYKEELEEARAGTIMKFYFEPKDGISFAVQDANWAKVEFHNDPNFDAQWGSINVPEGESSYEIELTQEVLNIIMVVDDTWSTTAIIVGGDAVVVTKVTLIM